MSNWSGFESTWEEFVKLDPLEVRKRAGVSYDETLQLYTVKSFGQDFYISIDRRDVFSDSPEGKFLLDIKDYFVDLSVLWYLIATHDIPLSGDLIKPADLPGGQIFVQGTHVLPLDEIAVKFNHRKKEFLERGKRFGGIEVDHGDVGIKLLPFPKVPVYVSIWFGDKDFQPRGQLLLDRTCPNYLATDVVWAMTTVCCQLFLRTLN